MAGASAPAFLFGDWWGWWAVPAWKQQTFFYAGEVMQTTYARRQHPGVLVCCWKAGFVQQAPVLSSPLHVPHPSLFHNFTPRFLPSREIPVLSALLLLFGFEAGDHQPGDEASDFQPLIACHFEHPLILSILLPCTMQTAPAPTFRGLSWHGFSSFLQCAFFTRGTMLIR